MLQGEYSLLHGKGELPSFDDKYLLTLTLRADGSSRLAEEINGTRSIRGFAWNVSRENFMQGIPAITNLKLRNKLWQYRPAIYQCLSNAGAIEWIGI